MNSRVPDELISAYFDGEASPEERAAVERQLVDSDEVRHELDETARLSALLHSIPRESAPSQLAADVQSATDRMPLAASALPAQKPAARNMRREWIAAGTAALVTAASLLLCVRLFEPSHDPSQVSNAPLAERAITPLPKLASTTDLSGNELTKSDIVLEEVQNRSNIQPFSDRPQVTSTPSVSAEMGGHAPSKMQARPAAEPTAVGRIASTTSANGIALPARPLDTASDSNAANAVGNTPGSQQLENSAANVGLSNGAFLEGLKVGNVYEFVPQPADPVNNVAVVDVEVVDIDRGAETIQILLKRNSILPRAVGDKNSEKAAGGAKDAKVARSEPSSKNDELVVVYAAGPGGQLAKTLEDVSQHPDLFLDWSSQPPVQLAMDDDSQVRGKSAASEKKDGGATDKQNLNENRKGSDSDTVEAEQAVQSLVTRNAMQYGENAFGNRQNRAMNSLASELARNEARPGDAGASATASPTKSSLNQAGNSAVPTEKPDRLLGVSGAARDGANDRGAQGFQQVFRLPMTEQAPLADQIANQSQNQNQNQNSQTDYALNGMRRRIALPVPQGLAGPADATRNNEANHANRAVKMLFVLHQTPVGQGSPAPMLKARQQ